MLALDCETYPNYFLAAFMTLDGRRGYVETSDQLTQDDRKKLLRFMRKETFGFNSLDFDLPVIYAALDGHTAEAIQMIGDDIIQNSMRVWETKRRYDLGDYTFDHFDIKEPAPGVMISLKMYGARANSQKLQDLPYEPGTHLTEAQKTEVREYCFNDLQTTIDLYRKIEGRIDLRRSMSTQYGIDLRSKSDAQIAEAVIKSEIGIKRVQVTVPDHVTYKAPDFIKFEDPSLQDVLTLLEDTKFELNKGNGSIKMPRQLSGKKIKIGDTSYKLGIGGLHSKEKMQSIVPTESQILADRDVASYYPFIILNLGLYPTHIGAKFLEVYRSIVDRRLTAKLKGDKVTNESLKIVLNGSFGKLGSKYSSLYSPDLMLTVTLTGQLSLLMLIERLEAAGIEVVSANTDGIVSLMDKSLYDLYDTICFSWELETGFTLEETRYRGLHSRDVNSYVAVKMDGSTKGKGAYAEPSLMKNPQNQIAIDAAHKWLSDGTPVADTICTCNDVSRFLTARTVAGGGEWKGQYLGKVVRWVYGRGGEKIVYKKNGNKVGGSDGAVPVMDLDGIPENLDRAAYVSIAEDLIRDTGAQYD